MEQSKLREDEFVFQIVKDPLNPPETMLVMGYIGRAAAEGSIRLYLDPLLSAFVDVPEASILYSEPLPRAQAPFGGHYIWVLREPEFMRDLQEAYQKAAQTMQEVNAHGQGTSLPATDATGWPSMSSQGFSQSFNGGFGQPFGNGFGQR